MFEHTLPGNEAAPMSTGSPFGAMASLFAPKLPGGLATDKLKPIKRERQAVRPPVEHKWSLPEVDQVAKPPVIFQHELIQSFSINMFCKVWLPATIYSSLCSAPLWIVYHQLFH